MAACASFFSLPMLKLCFVFRDFPGAACAGVFILLDSKCAALSGAACVGVFSLPGSNFALFFVTFLARHAQGVLVCLAQTLLCFS
jgi:hypothetical protein